MLNKNSKSHISLEEGTVIGAGVTLIGTLQDKGPITIHGKAKGEISSMETVIIGESAQIEGPIKARSVLIAGKTNGEIEADEKLEIHSSGVVEGRIKANHLAIESGAIFIGESDMRQVQIERNKVNTEPPVIEHQDEKKDPDVKKKISQIYEVEE